jgi:hypothetical protein
MKFLFLFCLSLNLVAATQNVVEPQHWGAALEIVDKHEFYEENRPITSPPETWQTLFAVTYITRNLKKVKDCVLYQIPGKTTSGMLKIISIPVSQDCSTVYFGPGDREVRDIQSLQYSSAPEGVELRFAQSRQMNLKWDVILIHPKISEPKMGLSSAEFKAGKVILLSSVSKDIPSSPPPTGKCHDIDDHCQEISASRCSQCADGWYEVPNGCPSGPKFCGVDHCGQKNQPACRRGMKYQQEDKKFECRIDHSFAYCNPGLVIQCEGSLAYCR